MPQMNAERNAETACADVAPRTMSRQQARRNSPQRPKRNPAAARRGRLTGRPPCTPTRRTTTSRPPDGLQRLRPAKPMARPASPRKAPQPRASSVENTRPKPRDAGHQKVVGKFVQRERQRVPGQQHDDPRNDRDIDIDRADELLEACDDERGGKSGRDRKQPRDDRAVGGNRAEDSGAEPDRAGNDQLPRAAAENESDAHGDEGQRRDFQPSEANPAIAASTSPSRIVAFR